METKQIMPGDITRSEGHGGELNVVFPVVYRKHLAGRMSEMDVGRLLEVSPLRIALGLISFWLLCSPSSAARMHLSLWTLSPCV